MKFAQESLMLKILPVLDNFERALSHKDEENTNLKGLLTGIELVFKQLTEILKGSGLERLNTSGEIFDPHFHEAIAYVQEEGKDHEIIEEIEPGYMFKGKLLKAARVRVRILPSENSEDQFESKE